MAEPNLVFPNISDLYFHLFSWNLFPRKQLYKNYNMFINRNYKKKYDPLSTHWKKSKFRVILILAVQKFIYITNELYTLLIIVCFYFLTGMHDKVCLKDTNSYSDNCMFLFLDRYACQGLFERHKLLFSFQMGVNILECANKINMDEYSFFLCGGVVSGHTFSVLTVIYRQ